VPFIMGGMVPYWVAQKERAVLETTNAAAATIREITTSGGDITWTATAGGGDITTENTVDAGTGDLTIAGGGAITIDSIVDGRGTTLNAVGAFDNLGAIRADGGGVTVTGAGYTGGGDIESGGAVSIASTGVFTNGGTIESFSSGVTVTATGAAAPGSVLAAGAIDIRSTGAGLNLNAVTLNAGGALTLYGDAGITGTSTGGASYSVGSTLTYGVGGTLDVGVDVAPGDIAALEISGASTIRYQSGGAMTVSNAGLSVASIFDAATVDMTSPAYFFTNGAIATGAATLSGGATTINGNFGAASLAAPGGVTVNGALAVTGTLDATGQSVTVNGGTVAIGNLLADEADITGATTIGAATITTAMALSGAGAAVTNATVQGLGGRDAAIETDMPLAQAFTVNGFLTDGSLPADTLVAIDTTPGEVPDPDVDADFGDDGGVDGVDDILDASDPIGDGGGADDGGSGGDVDDPDSLLAFDPAIGGEEIGGEDDLLNEFDLGELRLAVERLRLEDPETADAILAIIDRLPAYRISAARGGRGLNNGRPFTLVGGLVSYEPQGEDEDGDPVRELIRRIQTSLNLGLVQF